MTLSQEHLDTAIKIKLELQKSSPSQRCNWHKHNKMMEAEGFFDSEKSEAYRQLIKTVQRERGQLPSVQKYAEMVSLGTLESIKTEIGEINEAKLSARLDFLKLNRLKRELHSDVAFIEELRTVMESKTFAPIPFTPVFVDDESRKKMIVGVSDAHYGAVVDIEGFKYNPEIAEELMMSYANKLIVIAENENVDEFYVVGMGDAVESAYMRHSQPYGIDGTLSDQINDAADLFIKFLTRLAQFAKVKYAGINGNHDRMSSKNDTIYSDGAVKIINYHIKLYAEYAPVNIEYIESEPYHHIVSMNGKNFLFVHGDITPIKKASVLAEQSALYGIQFDALLAGHIHHFTMREVGFDKYVATFGSIKGSDEYSLKTIGANSSRSQGIVIIDEDGDFDIRKIKL